MTDSETLMAPTSASEFHIFNKTDLGDLNNINDLINTSSNNNTPMRRIISTSKTSSEINSDAVYHTPTKTTPDHYAYLRSPSRSSARSRRHFRLKYLRKDNNHHRLLRNQPSKLDLLDPGFTSFPLEPPEADITAQPIDDQSTPTSQKQHVIQQQQHEGQKSMYLVEDYIEESRKLFGYQSRKGKKLSVLDFKRGLREQLQLGMTYPSFGAFANASLILNKSKEQSDTDTIKSTNTLLLPPAKLLFQPSTFSSTSTVRDNFFSTTGSTNTISSSSRLNDNSSSIITTSKNLVETDVKRCVVCEAELKELPTESLFKELVCFDCTEQYEHLVTLINSELVNPHKAHELREEEHFDDNDEDDDDDVNSEDYRNLRPMSVSPCEESRSTRKRGNDFDQESDDETGDNFDKVYRSLKRIQDENLKRILETSRKKRFHNPLIKVVTRSTIHPAPLVTRKLNFNFNEVRPSSSFRSVKDSIEKFKELTLKYPETTNSGDDFWIKAKTLISWYTTGLRNEANMEATQHDDNESFVRWA